jgi:hypothetical protein
MSIEFLKEKSIKYLNKDFQGFKRDLLRFSQAHHSGVFQDYNESSPGMAIMEVVAYIGDVLSFYQDVQFSELKQETARELENVVSIAKQHGYKPSGKAAAQGSVSFFVEVPATTLNGVRVPDERYSPILRAGAKVSVGSVSFETTDDVYFSASSPTDDRMVTGSRFDNATGLPTHFALKKEARIVAGETKTDTISIDDFQPFRTVELSNQDVIEVLSVTDSDGNEWVEVDYLARDMVFSSDTNSEDDNDVVPSVMKLVSVPRRFIIDRDPTTSKSSLIFGSGDGLNFDDELVPNLADLALPLPGRRTFTSFPIDPQNFLKTRSLGLSPFNTTLTVKYRTGGGSQTNVPAGAIKSVDDAVLDFTSTGLSPSSIADVKQSLECINPKKTEGGGSEETISEIKVNSAAFFAAQDRVVTREDYIARILSLPAKFGKPEKVYVRKDDLNPQALNIHILAKDADGHMTQATSTLTKNIRTYLSKYRMMTDGVNLLQTNIINLKVDFGIVVSPKLNRTEVLAKCLTVVKDYLNISGIQISQPIVISDLLSEIQNVYGVVSVYKLQFKNMAGTVDGLDYSQFSFDVQSSIKNNILYCPENAIFEVKFPNRDIVGESR